MLDDSSDAEIADDGLMRRDDAREHVGIHRGGQRLPFGQRGIDDLLAVGTRQHQRVPHRLLGQRSERLIAKRAEVGGGQMVRLRQPLQRANGAGQLAVDFGGLGARGGHQLLLGGHAVVIDDARDEQRRDGERGQQRTDDQYEQVRAKREVARHSR